MSVLNDWCKHTLSSVKSIKNPSNAISFSVVPQRYYWCCRGVARQQDLGCWIYPKWMVYHKHIFNHCGGIDNVSHQKEEYRETEIDKWFAITIAFQTSMLLAKYPGILKQMPYASQLWFSVCAGFQPAVQTECPLVACVESGHSIIPRDAVCPSVLGNWKVGWSTNK